MAEVEKILTFQERIEGIVKKSIENRIDDITEEVSAMVEEECEGNISDLQDKIDDFETAEKKAADEITFQQRYSLGISKNIERPYEMLEEIAVVCRKAGYPLGYDTPLGQVERMARGTPPIQVVKERERLPDDLACIVSKWNSLPVYVKAGVSAMVATARG